MSTPFARPFRLRAPLAILVICFIGLISFIRLNTNNSLTQQEASTMSAGTSAGTGSNSDSIYVDPSLNAGGTIMPRLGNATAKAELGRATWKLLHTMASRYPVIPTQDERAAMKQWIFLLSRLYPCGECAEHFQQMLKEHPPQTSSRAALSDWSCSVHNIVNARLGKKEFDCRTLSDVYKCGCADEPKDGKDDGPNSSKEATFDPIEQIIDSSA
ncbi:hypothetical protein BG011_006954 [Mortierella polycephala]|uniref:Sulfhydryl oxidase n=1 Tax=Mortierella polycephala TaxID=41804 RepID=A0A9P6PRD3_9FUNG|nr:hypothetical protein BG011_006954 [Mortierella polycephala]